MERTRDFLSSAFSSSTQSNIPSSLPRSTDLRLGLSISSSSQHENSTSRNQPTFFVKVFNEEDPIGRKIDLYTLQNYDGLIQMLCLMFKISISSPNAKLVPSDKSYLLTYKDNDSDWMMVGDLPWNLFLTKVKKLMILRADKCYSHPFLS